MIRFSCPGCQTVMNAPDSRGGTNGKCPKCNQAFVIPRAEPPTAAITAVAPMPELPPPREEKPRQSTILFHLILWIAVILITVFVAISSGKPGESLGVFFWSLLIVMLPAIFGDLFGSRRAIGKQTGFLFGTLLSWLGVIVVLCYPDQGQTRKCPYCAERVKSAAIVCRHCGHSITR